MVGNVESTLNEEAFGFVIQKEPCYLSGRDEILHKAIWKPSNINLYKKLRRLREAFQVNYL